MENVLVQIGSLQTFTDQVSLAVSYEPQKPGLLILLIRPLKGRAKGGSAVMDKSKWLAFKELVAKVDAAIEQFERNGSYVDLQNDLPALK